MGGGGRSGSVPLEVVPVQPSERKRGVPDTFCFYFLQSKTANSFEQLFLAVKILKIKN